MKNEILYSDGDIENIIEEYLKNEENLSSSNDICFEQYDLWPIKYHLSSIRGNQIRHLDFSGLDILELGAGMGAMSRVLAESCNHLTVVEGTSQRMNCLKQRLRDLNNWDCFVCNYQDFNTERKYDVVCLFGVLEYAGRYIKDNDPFLWVLNFTKKFLKDDGVLLISIENKNGAKYYQGIAEDHYGLPYYGICGYPEVNDIKTFSRIELLNLLNNVGFKYTTLHHLSPDYKCTQAVLMDEFVCNYPIQAANIESNYSFTDYIGKTKSSYPQRLFLNSIAKSGLLKEFSNSYLYISSLKEDSLVINRLLSNVRDNKIEAILYSYGRRNEVKTTFFEQNKTITVKKEYKNPELLSNNIIKNIFHDDEMRCGVELKYLLENFLYYNKFDLFYKQLLSFIEYVFEEYKTESPLHLDIASFDLIPKNVILVKDKFIRIDNEYEILFDLTKDYFLFRVVLDLYEYSNYFKNSEYKCLYDLYRKLSEHFLIQNDLNSNIKKECDIHNAIFKKELSFEALHSILFNEFNHSIKLEKQTSVVKFMGIPLFLKAKDKNRTKINILGFTIKYEKSLF